MAIDSVTSSSSAYTSNVALQQTKNAQAAQPAERSEPKPEERVEKKEEAPKPVVNAQGQQTGSRINVTA